jgi:hypothetical protein
MAGLQLAGAAAERSLPALPGVRSPLALPAGRSPVEVRAKRPPVAPAVPNKLEARAAQSGPAHRAVQSPPAHRAAHSMAARGQNPDPRRTIGREARTSGRPGHPGLATGPAIGSRSPHEAGTSAGRRAPAPRTSAQQVVRARRTSAVGTTARVPAPIVGRSRPEGRGDGRGPPMTAGRSVPRSRGNALQLAPRIPAIADPRAGVPRAAPATLGSAAVLPPAPAVPVTPASRADADPGATIETSDVARAATLVPASLGGLQLERRHGLSGSDPRSTPT